MRNRMYGGVRGRKTKVGEKLLRFPPTRLCYLFNFSSSVFQKVFLFLPTKSYNSNLIHFVYAEILYVDLYTGIAAEHDLHGSSFSTCGRLYTSGNGK